jgi:hemoglobin-like flavoprotein
VHVNSTRPPRIEARHSFVAAHCAGADGDCSPSWAGALLKWAEVFGVKSSQTRMAGGLSVTDVELVRRTLAQIDANADDVVQRFYDALFERRPELKGLFVRSAADKQSQMFRETLYLIVDHLDDEPWVARTLARLGERHVGYGVTLDMYEPVGEALLTTLAQCLGADWTADVERAWQRAFAMICDLMIDRRE